MVVLMISSNEFPDGDAGSIRDYSFAKIYRDLGFQPVVICRNTGSRNGIYDGIPYYSTHTSALSLLDKIKRRKQIDRTIKQYIRSINEKYGRISVIHLYDAPLGTIKWIAKYCRNKSVMLIHDSVEWYSSCQFKMGVLDKAFILKDVLNRFIINRDFKVISISSYLERYFAQKGIVTVRIPVIMDVFSIRDRSIRNDLTCKENKKIRFIYAGSPAAKDYLKEIIEGVCELPEEIQNGMEMHILGVNEEQLSKLVNDGIPPCVKAYGRVPRKTVLETMQSMDFALLLRPENERYAKAGFPTKSVEAMAHGVAMLCNITSDLGMYLEDGENAIVVKDCSSKAVAEAILRVMEMSRQEIEAIKSKARKLAEEEFDYRLYVKSMKELLVQDK